MQEGPETHTLGPPMKHDQQRYKPTDESEHHTPDTVAFSNRLLSRLFPIPDAAVVAVLGLARSTHYSLCAAHHTSTANITCVHNASPEPVLPFDAPPDMPHHRPHDRPPPPQPS